jgi:arylformamidase
VSIIDISVALDSNIPLWPGSPGFKLKWIKKTGSGDEFNNSYLACDVHVGTHVDAPAHLLPNRKTVKDLELDILIGSCLVIYLPNIKEITADDLSGAKIPSPTERLLIKTDNSSLWDSEHTEFKQEFVALTHEAAQWLVQKGIRLVGIDYLSIGDFESGTETHRILLRNDIAVLEGLNLRNVEPDEYELICLPLKLKGAEGAPVRAVLKK